MPDQRRDSCSCGALRIELVVAPGRFYCVSCGVAGPGPRSGRPVESAESVGEQLSLDMAAADA